MSADIVDAQVVGEHGQELERVEHQVAPTNLFHTDDPVEVVERAGKVADALKGVLDRQGLTADVGRGKRHVLVEGWTTLGAMVGVTAVPAWTRPLEGKAPEGKVFGWEARVEARTLDGRVIGAAEAMCTRAESRWKGADDYAIRSMAQTRATSKALRGPLGFVVTLAGYESTPAEEITEPDHEPQNTDVPAPMTAEQYQQLKVAFHEAGQPWLKLANHLSVEDTQDAVEQKLPTLTEAEAGAATAFLRGIC